MICALYIITAGQKILIQDITTFCRLRIEDEIGAAFSSRYCYRVIRLALIGKICDLVERLNFHGWKVAILGGLSIAAQLTRQIGVFLLY